MNAIESIKEERSDFLFKSTYSFKKIFPWTKKTLRKISDELE
jgi:hypothetical protein